jgi:hypothetical protein
VLAKLHRWSKEGHLTMAPKEKGESAGFLPTLTEPIALNREDEAWPIFERASARPDADDLYFTDRVPPSLMQDDCRS